METSPVFSIIGGTIWGNRGAESMLVTTIGRIRAGFPDARFFVFSYYPTKDRELINDERITILSGKPTSLATRHFIGALAGLICKSIGLGIPKGSFFKIARALSESKMLLDIGGITFSDGREKYLPFNVLTIWPAMMLGVPVVKMAQAVGPFNNFINRFFARKFLFRCEHIFARGEKTSEFLSQLGLAKDKLDTVADIAFLYNPKYSLSRENEDIVNELIGKLEKIKTKKVIAISPSILVNEKSRKQNQDYGENLLEVIKNMGVVDYHFVFIPNATRGGSDKKMNNDLIIINTIKEMVATNPAYKELSVSTDFINYDLNTKSLREIIAKADILITSRYHSMISGLCLGIPTIVVGWGHKYEETLSSFELEKYCVDFREITGLIELVENALINSEKISAKIKQKLVQVEKKASYQFDLLEKGLR